MNVISITSALRMPNAIRSPKTRTLVTWNVASDAKPEAAMSPAVTITGPECPIDEITAARESPSTAYSS